VKKIIAHVDPDLRELIPGYLQNRRKDIKAIGAALKGADLLKIRTLDHSMKGSAGRVRIHAHQCDWRRYRKSGKRKGPGRYPNSS